MLREPSSLLEVGKEKPQMLPGPWTSVLQSALLTASPKLSDLPGSRELQDPQGPSPYTLSPRTLRGGRPWAGHSDSKQRAGPVEERLGSGPMPARWVVTGGTISSSPAFARCGPQVQL